MSKITPRKLQSLNQNNNPNTSDMATDPNTESASLPPAQEPHHLHYRISNLDGNSINTTSNTATSTRTTPSTTQNQHHCHHSQLILLQLRNQNFKVQFSAKQEEIQIEYNKQNCIKSIIITIMETTSNGIGRINLKTTAPQEGTELDRDSNIINNTTTPTHTCYR